MSFELGGGFKVVVYDIRVALDVHVDWVVPQMNVTNTFNTILCKVAFQKLRVLKGWLYLFSPFCSFFLCPLTSLVIESLACMGRNFLSSFHL